MRAAVLYLVLLGLAPCHVAGQSDKALRAAVEEMLDKGRFITRITIGNSHRYRDADSRQDLIRLIDTELYPDGRVTYLAIRGATYDADTNALLISGLFDKSFYVPIENLSNTFEPGTEVRVEDVKWHSDRMELELRRVPDESYGKVKFMFPKDFQKSVDRDAVLSRVTQALILDDFEKLRRVDAEYPALRDELEGARAGFASSTDSTRLETAEDLYRVLKSLEENRATKERLAPDSEVRGTDDSLEYGREAAELEVVLNGLREDRRQARLEELAASLSRKDEQVDSLLDIVERSRPSTLTAFRRQEGYLTEVALMLQERTTVVEMRNTLGAPEDTAVSNEHQRRLSASRAALSAQGTTIQRLQLAEDYREMGRRREAQRDTYTRAFGTPTFREEAQKYIALLQRMFENRTRAGDAGVSGAPEEAAALRQEIERTRERLRGSQWPHPGDGPEGTAPLGRDGIGAVARSSPSTMPGGGLGSELSDREDPTAVNTPVHVVGHESGRRLRRSTGQEEVGACPTMQAHARIARPRHDGVTSKS